MRGTSRRAEALEQIAATGIEPALADPDRLGTVLDQVGDIAVVVWLMGSATGPSETVAAVNGDRLESLMARLVDTPVRGFVYEAAGSAPAKALARGQSIVEEAAVTWRIPVVVLKEEPDGVGWVRAAAVAVGSVSG